MTRSQFYYDCDKRTARIMMTGELIAHGYESVGIPFVRRLDFNQGLESVFNTDDATELMSLLATCRAE